MELALRSLDIYRLFYLFQTPSEQNETITPVILCKT